MTLAATEARASVDDVRALSLPTHAAAYDEWLRATELASIVEVVGIYDLRPRAPRYVLHLAVRTSVAENDATTHALWTAFRGTATAIGLDVERRLLVKFAHLLDVSAADVVVNITGREQCWRLQLVIDGRGFRATERACGTVAHPRAIASDELRNLSRRIGVRTARPSNVLVGDARATIEERLASGTPLITDADLATRLATHFRRRGRYKVVQQSEHLLEVRVEDLRGEILIGDRRRWERLQLTLVTTPTDDGRLQVVLILDGQYAPGVGSRAPDPRNYRDMETTYAGELSTYARSLLNRLIDTEQTRGDTRSASR
ncbi:MAG TPA: hypothetical protein VF698_07280 [Thermoanaerobaculia bacterium]